MGISFEPMRRIMASKGLTFSMLVKEGVIGSTNAAVRLNRDETVHTNVLERIAKRLGVGVEGVMEYVNPDGTHPGDWHETIIPVVQKETLTKEQLWEGVLEALDAGDTVSAVARKFNLSYMAVRSIQSRATIAKMKIEAAKIKAQPKIRELPDKIKARKLALSMPETTPVEISAKITEAGLKAHPVTVAQWLENRQDIERLVAYYEQGTVLNPMNKEERNAGIKAGLEAGFKDSDVAWRYDVSVPTVKNVSKM